jgi:hypothetical protein
LEKSPHRTEVEARKSDLARGPCNENESRAGDWTQIESPDARDKDREETSEDSGPHARNKRAVSKN